MCGISGFLDRRAQDGDEALGQIVRTMNDTLAHRGPDGADIWTDASVGIALGHRRLAVVDLSPTGFQPMQSADGHYVATYNGEIFNFSELRAEIGATGHNFRGTSDTEVMLEGFSRWGVRNTVERLIGMFAIGLWDRQTRTLYLIRDRLGVKPLYYAQDGMRLLFGSELKALRAAPGFAPTLDRAALVAYFRHADVPGPSTIYREAKKLPPGTILTWREGKQPALETYWSARERAIAGRTHWQTPIDDADAIDALDTLLRDAVKRRMIADVPLGAFLSGGIDSSLVVALMQAQSDQPVKSFTIGFDAKGYDEAEHAKAVAAHLGLAHTELYVTAEQARDAIPKLPDIYDEPFADASQIPTFLVSRIARAHVTVALSGDGGDESFAGYNRHVWADRLESDLGFLPRWLRRTAATALTLPGEAFFDVAAKLIPAHRRPARPGEKAAKMAALLRADDPSAIYRQLVSQWPEPGLLVPGAAEPHGPLFDQSLAADMPEFAARMQLLDTLTYLPDDVLTKVDRATMAVGLEGRNPLLDHRVVEHAWRLPPQLKLRGGQGKWILREILARYVPRALFERPKMGFAVPIGAWLRGPLRDWGADLLDPVAIAADGILAPAPIAAAWAAHQAGEDRTYALWTVLMFRSWQKRWG
jgi:asparagine synthase (glutamine-hydrolysing)